MTKFCKFCTRELPFTSFCKHPYGAHGLSNKCRECQSTYSKTRNSTEEGKQAQKERMQEWLERPGKRRHMSNKATAWKKANPARVKARYKVHVNKLTDEELRTLSKVCSKCAIEKALIQFAKGDGRLGRVPRCKECCKTAAAVYSVTHSEHIKELAKAAYKRNKSSHQMRSAKRRAKIDIQVDKVDWPELLERFDHKCAYCGLQAPLTQDHVIPLSRGGTHTKDNLVPACGTCNSKKGAKLLSELVWVIRPTTVRTDL